MCRENRGVSRTVKLCQIHESLVVSTAASTDSVQLPSSYRLAAVHDPCNTSASDVEFMCAEKLEDFPKPTSCISSIIRPIRLHEPSIAQPTIQAPIGVFQLCPLVTRAQAKAFCRMTTCKVHPRLTAAPNGQRPSTDAWCLHKLLAVWLGPAQTEVVWKRVPWPPPLYASENVSHMMLRGWEGAAVLDLLIILTNI